MINEERGYVYGGVSERSTNPTLDNPDLAPSQIRDRTWNAWSYVAVWMGISHNINQWILAATLIAFGASFWESFAGVAFAFGLVYVGVILKSICGAKYGISCPVIMHAIFGHRAAKLAIFTGSDRWFSVFNFRISDSWSRISL